MTTLVKRTSLVKRSSLVKRASVVAGATGAALLVWAVATWIGGGEPALRQGGSVSAVAVVIASVVAGLVAWAWLALLERMVRRPRLVWTVTAVVVFVLSLAGPAAGTDVGAVLALFCLHLVVAAVLVAGLPARERG
jgi:hypothetical protein